ncbi:MAG: PEGA domain-containing protein [Deltaproteobacteria bacterium]|nr:PEGA domain-containing protein [Deltaproteobacteria bacterium]
MHTGIGRLVVPLLVMLASATATAQRRPSPPPAAVDPAQDEARKHFEAGVALMNVENWEAALVEFERSLELFPTRSALFNLGMCQKALFQYVEAMATFEQFLDRYAAEATAAEMDLLRANIAELGTLLGEILIGVNVDGATVAVDGLEVGVAPLSDPVRAVSGRHRVSVSLDGYNPAEREVTVTSGDRVTVGIELTEIPHVGTLRVEANVADAEVWIDGALAGTVPFTATLGEGDHELRVAASGYVAQTQSVALVTGEQRIATVSLVETPGTDPVWFWSMVGLTGAAGVVTVALAATVMVKDDEFRSTEFPTTAQYQEGRDLQLATDVCLGVTAAAAVAALVLGFTTDWGGEETPPDSGGEAAAGGLSGLGAVVGPAGNGVGLAVVGRF